MHAIIISLLLGMFLLLWLGLSKIYDVLIEVRNELRKPKP